MNYGDGLYGGQFVGGMYAEAFFESDPLKIVEAGLKCIPSGSQYAEAVRDVISWYKEYPDDWEYTWELINKKYHEDPEYRKFTSFKEGSAQNIDAKLNGVWQMVSASLNLYQRPIPTPVHNLRPARETCEKCHWPEKFYGQRLKSIVRYGQDEESTPEYTTLLLKVDRMIDKLGPR